jgi:hypothetical protein
MHHELESSAFSSTAVLLSYETGVDELLDLAARFSAGEVLLSSAAECLLLRLLQRKTQLLLQPGDELRHLNVSLKRSKDGASNVFLRKVR